MSKQMNFFILPDDLPHIYDFYDSNDIKYIIDKKKNTEDLVFRDFPYVHGKSYERIYLTSAQFTDRIYFIYNKDQVDNSLDREKSYVLEFNPGGFFPSSDKVLHRARFYCKTDYFVSNNERVVKDEKFKSWVDKIFRQFKKRFLIKTEYDKSILFSENALTWMKENNGKIDVPFLKITI